MKTRCKPGDLADFVRDEPGCEKNIDKIVEVRGPIRICKTSLVGSAACRPLRSGRPQRRAEHASSLGKGP
jgi:hypothetical protein